jgi:hypothetical protein
MWRVVGLLVVAGCNLYLGNHDMPDATVTVVADASPATPDAALDAAADAPPDAAIPDVPTPLTGIQSIAVGNWGACALINGGVQCWGRNDHGQLGNGTVDGIANTSVPTPVMNLTSDVEAIAAGGDYACALRDGGVWCWGSNDEGHLGNGTGADSAVPVAVVGLYQDVEAIVAGENHACALRDGDVWCWGRADYDQLGGANVGQMSITPVQVPGVSHVQALALGGVHTCALTDGAVVCWGAERDGQLGNNYQGTAQWPTSPTPVAAIGLASGVDAIAAGGSHTCALQNGGVQCWGTTSGLPSSPEPTDSHVPVLVPGVTMGVQAIANGSMHSCAIVNGGVQCWGDNAHGELGNHTSANYSAAPVAVAGLDSGVQMLASSGVFNCAVVAGGAWCWGNDRQAPVQVFSGP